MKLKNLKKNPLILFWWNENRRRVGERLFAKKSDEEFIEEFYFKNFNSKLDLKNPITYNQKLNWLKLNLNNSLSEQCADKYEVRKYIEEKGYKDILNELISVYEDVEKIDINELPERFVLKATHGSGWNLIVKNKNDISWTLWKKIMKSWLRQNYYYYGREKVYKNLKPRIVCEKFLEDKNGELLDYKFFCFDGKVKFIKVDIDRYKNHTANYYDTNWRKMPFSCAYNLSDRKIEKPQNLEYMMKIAQDLSIDFKHVRVDLYEVDGKIYFGELTFFNEAGTGKFIPEKYDEIVGAWLEI